MGTFKYKSSRMLIVLTAMAVLLPLLAALQYYWLGQVSEAASERLQSNVRANANAFREDFNREFIRAYLNFHMDSYNPPADIQQYHIQSLDQWNTTAPYPQLISDVFAVTYHEKDQPLLTRLDRDKKRFEAVDWTGEMANLRERFTRNAEASVPGRRVLESFADDIPALIVPFPIAAGEKSTGQTAPLPGGFTIIKLDLNYIQANFIPGLMRRHLLNPQSDYNVAIVSLDRPQRTIYSSGYPETDLASADVSTRVFGLEADELRNFANAEGPAPSNMGQPSARRRLLNVRLLKRPVIAPGVSNDEDGRWQLLIKHRAGSLAAAVSSARWRNLAISFGILLLLGTGILMTIISTRRAERLAQQQINFIAGVTHELRTPLAVICSAGENLADGIVDSPGKVAQYGQMVYREGRRLTDMVEQVLEFSGAQSGRQRYEFRQVNIADVVAGAVTACQPLVDEAGFNLETVVASDLPQIKGDEPALRRAVQNLISNAIKYGGQNRWARITAALDVSADRHELSITVEDRGPGINAADLAHIFEPFYRSEDAIAAQIKGSGVGLSLVKQIAEAHGGSITVRSSAGSGSVFTLQLPVLSEPPAVAGGPPDCGKSS